MEREEMTRPQLYSSREELIESFSTHVSKSKVEYYQKFGFEVVMGRREGVYFYDLDGRKFLNAHCNGGVFNMGHRHPALVGALVEGVEHWGIGNHHLISEPRAALAQRLAGLLPGDLDCVVYGVSGGEAVDTALKMARGLTGRDKVVSAKGGYHGHTGLSLATGDERYRAMFGPQLPGFVQVEFGRLEALEGALDEDTAALILEPIPATLGMPLAPEGYFEQARRLCDERGVMLIFDEIQTGLGRLGVFSAAEYYGIVPDFVVFGKGLSGGVMPLAATCVRRPHMRIFAQDPFVHISTFGGSELACWVALKQLSLLTEEGFFEGVQARSAQLSEGLGRLQVGAPEILKEVRQVGMMIGLVWPTDGHGMLMSKLLLDLGMFAVYANNDRRVTQFLLPLVSTAQEVQEGLEILGRAIQQIQEPELGAFAVMLNDM